MRVGQARRRDSVEKPIVAAWRRVGAEVWLISGPGAPDALVRFQGHLYAFEIKTAKGKRTQAQEVSQFPVVRTEPEALAAIGATR